MAGRSMCRVAKGGSDEKDGFVSSYEDELMSISEEAFYSNQTSVETLN